MTTCFLDEFSGNEDKFFRELGSGSLGQLKDGDEPDEVSDNQQQR